MQEFKKKEKDFANPPAWHIMQFRHSFVKGTEIMLDEKALHAPVELYKGEGAAALCKCVKPQLNNWSIHFLDANR